MELKKMKVGRILGITAFTAMILTLALRFPGHAAAQKPDTSTLTVRVTGARNTKGKIGVTLFQDAKSFPDNAANAIRQQSVEIDPGTLSAQVVFPDLPRGVYAASVLHDENGNGKMDKNFMGVPKEGYGASNNPKKKMRAPTFEEAKFSLNDAEQTIEIKLIY
jgi:uncharacterized protein (DUF2141 family)